MMKLTSSQHKTCTVVCVVGDIDLYDTRKYAPLALGVFGFSLSPENGCFI
jgi:hypothetical protein